MVGARSVSYPHLVISHWLADKTSNVTPVHCKDIAKAFSQALNSFRAKEGVVPLRIMEEIRDEFVKYDSPKKLRIAFLKETDSEIKQREAMVTRTMEQVDNTPGGVRFSPRSHQYFERYQGAMDKALIFTQKVRIKFEECFPEELSFHDLDTIWRDHFHITENYVDCQEAVTRARINLMRTLINSTPRHQQCILMSRVYRETFGPRKALHEALFGSLEREVRTHPFPGQYLSAFPEE